MNCNECNLLTSWLAINAINIQSIDHIRQHSCSYIWRYNPIYIRSALGIGKGKVSGFWVQVSEGGRQGRGNVAYIHQLYMV